MPHNIYQRFKTIDFDMFRMTLSVGLYKERLTERSNLVFS